MVCGLCKRKDNGELQLKRYKRDNISLTVCDGKADFCMLYLNRTNSARDDVIKAGADCSFVFLYLFLG